MAVPLVSIVIVNYNYERFLSRSIESALAQAHPRTQVVVVDDGSTDGSAAVIRGYGERVVPVIQPRNRGQGAGFNAGFQASSGEVVMFLDSDDWLYAEAAGRAAGAFAPGVAKVQFRLDMVDGEGRRIDLFPAPEVAFDDGDVVPLLLDRGRYETTVTTGNAFTREALAAILPVPEEEFRISADGYVVTLVPLFGRVASIQEPLGAYVVHGNNNWAVGRNDPAEGFRKAVTHDFHRHAALKRKAAEVGLAVSENPGLRDPLHLSYRLGSLTMDPASHPARADRRSALALRGAWAARGARLPAARRVVLSTWFLAAGLLPRRLARPLIAWRMLPATRPPGVKRMLRKVRDLLR